MRKERLPALVALFGILSLAAVLRFVQLGHDSIWVDEAFSARVSNLGLTDLIRTATADDTNPPVYYVLLHFWTDVFGDSAAALRSLSAVVGVLLVFVVFKLGERLSSTRAGLIAALLAAVSEFLVHYSQEARVYSLLALLSASSYYFLLVLLDGLRPWPIAGYVLTTTALLYAHTYGLFVLAAQAAFFGVALLGRRDWIRMRDPERLGMVLGAPLVLAVPWLVVFAGHVSDEVERHLRCKAELACERRPRRDLPGTLSGYAGSRWGLVLALVALCVGCRCCSEGEWCSRRRGPARQGTGASAFSCSGPLIPIAVPFVLSLVVTPIYQFKYTIPSAVACYFLLALALEDPGTEVRAGRRSPRRRGLPRDDSCATTGTTRPSNGGRPRPTSLPTRSRATSSSSIRAWARRHSTTTGVALMCMR